MACAAGALALKNAGISDRPSSRSEIGFYMNLAHGSTWAEPEHIRPLLKNGYQLEQINVFPFIVPNSVTGTVCRVLSLTGYNNTFCNGPEQTSGSWDGLGCCKEQSCLLFFVGL